MFAHVRAGDVTQAALKSMLKKVRCRHCRRRCCYRRLLPLLLLPPPLSRMC